MCAPGLESFLEKRPKEVSSDERRVQYAVAVGTTSDRLHEETSDCVGVEIQLWIALVVADDVQTGRGHCTLPGTCVWLPVEGLTSVGSAS